tara:strand:- start:3729 stop:4184 length:456 start_codon:yes stop_codon:yes gene_type:complete
MSFSVSHVMKDFVRAEIQRVTHRHPWPSEHARPMRPSRWHKRRWTSPDEDASPVLRDSEVGRIKYPVADVAEPFPELGHDGSVEVVRGQNASDILSKEPRRPEVVDGVHRPWPSVAVVFSSESLSSVTPRLTGERAEQQVTVATGYRFNRR